MRRLDNFLHSAGILPASPPGGRGRFALALGLISFLTVMGLAFGPMQFEQSSRLIVDSVALPPNTVHAVARHCQKYYGDLDAAKLSQAENERIQAECADDPSTIFQDTTTTNLRVNAGINWQADLMSDTTTPPVNAQCNYIALTNTAITPGATDTTLSGEIVANGLSRAQAAYNHTSNATSYTLTKTFTCATAPQAAQAEAVFTASSGGTMCFEDTFTQASLQVGDTLAITHTVNF